MAKAKALKKLAEKVKKHKELAALAGAQGAAVAGVYAMDKKMRKELQKQGNPVPDNLIDEIKAQIKRRRKAKPKKKYTGGVVRKQAGGFVHRRNQRRQG